jgi:hypothetical protein
MLKKSLFLFLLFLSCARQIAPSGGPDDKTPPSVRYTVPAIGAVNFPVKGTVTFFFSEWLDKKTAERCVSVFPQPPDGIKIKATGKTIELRALLAFADSTTYHIEFNTLLSDLHGNAISSPFHFYFSTGPSIDSGKLIGCIASDSKPSLQPKAALFAAQPAFFPDSGYFGLPSYLVQTDSSGGFIFDHIRRGTYRLIAFADANGNNRLEPGIEQAFAPVNITVTIDSAAGPMVLYPVTSDTVTNRIISLKAVSNRVVAGTWARPSDSIAVSALAQWRVQTTNAAAAMLRIKEYTPQPRTPRFFLTFTDTMSVTPYRLWYSAPRRTPRDKNPFFRDSIRFDGVRFADTLRPAVVGFSPSGIAGLKPLMKLFWSKPVTPSQVKGSMADSLGDTVPVALASALSDTTVITVQRALKPATKYALRFPAAFFSDISGNHPRDSSFGKYVVQTMSGDNLCYSLSGGAPCLSKTQNARWIFMPIGSADFFMVNDSVGRFRFDSIPSGKGRLGYFIDFNGDGKPTSGCLVPWVKPEPSTLFPDTVEARARWDIEGIEVPACEACARKKNAPETASPSNALPSIQNSQKKN